MAMREMLFPKICLAGFQYFIFQSPYGKNVFLEGVQIMFVYWCIMQTGGTLKTSLVLSSKVGP